MVKKPPIWRLFLLRKGKERTLLADPKILILDEAAASIDTEMELVIQRALETLLSGRTTAIIARRLSTICDAIILSSSTTASSSSKGRTRS